MPSKLEYSLSAVNARLAISLVRVRLQVRGGRIWIQGTFPPKPGSDRPRDYQQQFSLKVPASADGFRQADKEARLIGAELASKEFRWEKYLSPDRLPETKPCKRWIAEFKEHYLARHEMKPSTWNGDWMSIYKRLPQDEPLTPEVMRSLIFKTDPNTRNRLETCRKFQKLADFAKLDAAFLEFEGNYGPSKVKDRDIPSDEVIAAQWAKIPNSGWRWVYGIMAAFGLRDHEVFFCEWTDDGLQILKGKTGPRLVFQPLYPEWVDEWDLRNVTRPKIQDPDDLYSKQQLGTKVARAFNRQGVPFTPYDLRHAFGIRASVTFELPVTSAAALMGHSPKVHLERYHKHIQLKQNQGAVSRLMQRPDRPQAPKLPAD
jgi:integrase